ncbi:hypothetical protein [Streptomyces sp. A5-4]|uniref:hypothetical protein n=1 Tax=Streptomyces sp. A5-4 TaxID=3384771 RepID=UPI003DA8DAA3
MSTAHSVDPNDDSTVEASDHRLPEDDPEPVYCGLCFYPSDIGLSGYDNTGSAYVDPTCPDHAEPLDHPYEEVAMRYINAAHPELAAKLPGRPR